MKNSLLLSHLLDIERFQNVHIITQKKRYNCFGTITCFNKRSLCSMCVHMSFSHLTAFSFLNYLVLFRRKYINSTTCQPIMNFLFLLLVLICEHMAIFLARTQLAARQNLKRGLAGCSATPSKPTIGHIYKNNNNFIWWSSHTHIHYINNNSKTHCLPIKFFPYNWLSTKKL